MPRAAATAAAAAKGDGNDIEMKQSRETMATTSNMTIERGSYMGQGTEQAGDRTDCMSD